MITKKRERENKMLFNLVHAQTKYASQFAATSISLFPNLFLLDSVSSSRPINFVDLFNIYLSVFTLVSTHYEGRNATKNGTKRLCLYNPAMDPCLRTRGHPDYWS